MPSGLGMEWKGKDEMKTVLGVSGSPIANSNTDRALKAVLEAPGLETSDLWRRAKHVWGA